MSDAHTITVGRYLLHRKIARGGMATIHIARLMGDVGFSRIVAAKRMHPELAEDKEFVSMFLDEASIASKVHHRNVVPVLDVVTHGEEVVLVQEYVHGAPLSLLLRQTCEAKGHVPVPVAAAIACQVLAGLHAAHETVDEMGAPMNIVHRDVSPQNIMVATDGSARLLDFGVAKTSVAAHVTRKGTFKGKLGYSSPEQIRGQANKQSDIYSLGVVLWECLVGQRLHANAQGEAALIAEIMNGKLATITEALADEKTWIGAYRWSQLEALEPIIRKALDVNHKRRWTTAAEMEEAIAHAVPLAPAADIEAWLRAVGQDFLDSREQMIAEEEASWRRTLAMTAQAVPIPTEVNPIVNVSTGVATEPEGEQRHHGIFQRGPTAFIAMLVVLLFSSVAFLLRDLDDRPSTSAAPSPPAVAAPAVAAPIATPVAAPPVKPAAAKPAPVKAAPAVKTVAAPPEVPAEIASTTMALPDPDEQLEEAIEKPPARPPQKPARERPKSSSRERVVVAKQPSRSPPKPTPAPPPPPAKTQPTPPAKPAVDCSTPFYFEGSKKIFKPGCL